MWRDVVKLITLTITKDAIGQEVITETYTEAFAEKNGIQRTEFFTAGQTGIKPALMFKIREIDYNGEESLEFEGVTYKIYRTYPKGEMIELYCEFRSGVNG